MDTTLFSFATLHRAWLDCRKGKAGSPAAMAFEADLERNLFSLGEELRSRSYRPSPSVCFITDQPKRREIFAAAFRDRVVHHLVVRHIEPYWEPKFIHDSFACRRNKGTHAAVDRVQHFLRKATANGSRRAWILHLDIRSFFVRINKVVLFRLLADGLKRQEAPWESEMHWLIKCIVFSDPTQSVHRIGTGFAAVPNHKSLFQTGNVCGLPIGNYTSQFFANVYLNPLDQFVKHNLRMRHYLRYVDDLILISRDREALVEAEQRIGCFLDKELKLDLNGNRRRLAAASSGIDALGYVIHTHHRLLRRRTLRRFQRRLRAGEQALAADLRKWNGFRVDTQQSEKLLAQSMSYRGLLQKASCQRLVRRIQQKYCLPGLLWRLDLRNRVRRRYRLAGTPHTLVQQWRMFREQWPGARLLMQVGGYWEAYGDDADWLRGRLALDEGRSRRGLGRSAGFPVRDRARLRSMLNGPGTDTLVWICQTDRVSGNLMERVVHFVQPPCGTTSPDAGLKSAGRDGRSIGRVFDGQPLWLDSHKQENLL